MSQPIALKKWTISEGSESVEIGLYAYEFGICKNTGESINARGFVVCPVATAHTDLPEDVRPKSKVKPSTENPPLEITEKQLAIASYFSKLLRSRAKNVLLHEVKKDLVFLANDPRLEIADKGGHSKVGYNESEDSFQSSNSSKMYVYCTPRSANSTTAETLLDKLINHVDLVSQDFNDQGRINKANDLMRNTIKEKVDDRIQRTNSSIFRDIVNIMNKHFPGDASEKAKLEALANIKKLLGLDKNGPGHKLG